eukprot:scaffold3958_cov63-Phaeocystis_antarctica.AAC.2
MLLFEEPRPLLLERRHCARRDEGPAHELRHLQRVLPPCLRRVVVPAQQRQQQHLLRARLQLLLPQQVEHEARRQLTEGVGGCGLLELPLGLLEAVRAHLLALGRLGRRQQRAAVVGRRLLGEKVAAAVGELEDLVHVGDAVERQRLLHAQLDPLAVHEEEQAAHRARADVVQWDRAPPRALLAPAAEQRLEVARGGGEHGAVRAEEDVLAVLAAHQKLHVVRLRQLLPHRREHTRRALVAPLHRCTGLVRVDREVVGAVAARRADGALALAPSGRPPFLVRLHLGGAH